MNSIEKGVAGHWGGQRQSFRFGGTTLSAVGLLVVLIQSFLLYANATSSTVDRPRIVRPDVGAYEKAVGICDVHLIGLNLALKNLGVTKADIAEPIPGLIISSQGYVFWRGKPVNLRDQKNISSDSRKVYSRAEIPPGNYQSTKCL